MFNSVRFVFYKLGILFTDITISVLYMISYIFLPFTKAIVTKLLNDSGIQVNGSSRCDPKVVDNRFFCLFAKHSYTGFVDAYQYEYFECNDLTEFFLKINRSKHYNSMCYHPSLMWRSFFTRHFFVLSEVDSIGESYDEGGWNWGTLDDERKAASTGYWRNANTLDESYEAKHDLIARKLKLKQGLRVIDVGCGEGPLCRYLAKNYDLEVTGVNVSKEMIARAQKFSGGLKITYKVMDARRITGKYDRITCIGMIEHLGAVDLRDFFKTVHRCLTNDGIFLLETYTVDNPFTPIIDGCSARVFGMFCNYPYFLDILKAVEGLFVIEDCQNLRHHSALSMKECIETADRKYDELVAKYGKKTVRGTRALYAEATALEFGAHIQVCQFVFSKNGLKEGYDTVV